MYRSSAFLIFDGIQVAMSAVACGLSVWACRSGLLNLRPLHAAVAMLAAVYCAGYLYLIVEQPNVGDWSNVMRGVGLVAWPVAWVSWPILSIRLQSRVGRLHRVVEERTDLLEDAA